MTWSHVSEVVRVLVFNELSVISVVLCIKTDQPVSVGLSSTESCIMLLGHILF